MIFQKLAGRVATRTFQFGPQTGLVTYVVILESLKTFAFLCSGIAKHISQRKNGGVSDFLGFRKKNPHVFFCIGIIWSRSGPGEGKHRGKNSPNTKKSRHQRAFFGDLSNTTPPQKSKTPWYQIYLFYYIYHNK